MQFTSLAKAWDQHIEVKYDRGTFVSVLHETFSQWKGGTGLRVVVDLSGMSSYVLYRVLSLIWTELQGAQVAIYYAEGQEYAPTRGDWEMFYKSVPEPHDNLAIAESYEQNHFQSVGIDDTYESDVFPGENIWPPATEIVAIPSFSLQRMKAMLAFAEGHYNVRSADVRWFLGHPPDRVRNGWRMDALAKLYNVGDRAIAVSTRDYRDAFLRLDTIWESGFTERHFVLAPLGSKMQHLGCFLFLKMHSECGLILCEPVQFIAGNYSQGVGPRWWLDIGVIQNLKDLLAEYGELRFHWGED